MNRKKGRGAARKRKAPVVVVGESSKKENDFEKAVATPKKDVSSKNLDARLPKMENDNEDVVCETCRMECSYRQFRIHNIEAHYNLAVTTDEENVVKDRRFYSRKLQEMAKLTGRNKFVCPHEDCDASYKSALGLGFHLETCNRTQEEIEACLVECPVCNVKMPASHIYTHKKSHEKKEEEAKPTSKRNDISQPQRQRKSALKAKKKFKDVKSDVEDDEESSPTKPGMLDEDFTLESENVAEFNIRDCEDETFMSGSTEDSKPFESDMSNFIPECFEDPWDSFVINDEDPFPNIEICSFNTYDGTKESLFSKSESLEFKTALYADDDNCQLEHRTSLFHRLSVFEGENITGSQNYSITYCGGKVSTLSWHPSGKYLAVAVTPFHCKSKDLSHVRKSLSLVEIYSFELNDASKVTGIPKLKLSIVLNGGVVNHMEWCNFSPKGLNIEDFVGTDKLGYLACAVEDGSIYIYMLHIADLSLAANFVFKTDSKEKVPVYERPAVMVLKPMLDNYTEGQCTKFNWHEKNKYLAAGYTSGLLAVYDLFNESELIRSEMAEGLVNQILLLPIWTVRAHTQILMGVLFDPSDVNYIVTASEDRYVKVWDLRLRMLVESKRVGVVIDTCWVRGWIHVIVSSDFPISNFGTICNFPRFYQIGINQGKPNCGDNFNVTSLTFHQGVTIQSTDFGTVTSTYYDQYWRVCDFERNKRKRNVVHLSFTELDPESYTNLTEHDFTKEEGPDLRKHEPRIILNFKKIRLSTLVGEVPDINVFEAYTRFHDYIRINKISLSPNGQNLAIGYVNGILSVIPSSFEEIFS